jgi:4-amino-4-deoxy-L-arabinose transferase-like glycosyltransferase
MKNLPKTLLILLFLCWMLPGLIGRDPWKADEPYSFGIISHIMQTGDTTVLMAAGVPFLEKPPLYYLSAALSGWLFAPILAQHDAVRIINLLWMFLTLLFLGLATRETAGKDAAWTAPILLAGCTLLQLPAHKLITDNALLTGFAVAYYGLAISRRRPGWGGFWTGTGMGIGFLTKGLFAPGVIVATALALPLLFPAWRKKEYARALGVAAIAALPWLVIWPVALSLRSREYFVEWFWHQNLGRFLGFSYIDVKSSHWSFVLHLPGLALPVLPPALWSWWHFRGHWRTHPVYQLPAVFLLVIVLVLSASSSIRDLYALPLLLPLTVIAAAGMEGLPDRIAGLIDRTMTVLFGLLGLALWLIWLARVSGYPVLSRVIPLSTVHYRPLDALLLGCAALITVLWLTVAKKTYRQDVPFPLSWTAGMMLTWGIAMTLWLPWLEGQSSFRDVFATLRESLPDRYQCIASYKIGESERAMLEYYAGVQVRPLEIEARLPCDLLLVVFDRERVDTTAIHDWHVEWKSIRPQERPKEFYTLYHLSPHRGRHPQPLSPDMIHLK